MQNNLIAQALDLHVSVATSTAEAEYERGRLYLEDGRTAVAIAEELKTQNVLAGTFSEERTPRYVLQETSLDGLKKVEQLIRAQQLPKEYYVKIGFTGFWKGVSKKMLEVGVAAQFIDWLVDTHPGCPTSNIAKLKKQWEKENAHLMVSEKPAVKIKRLETELEAFQEAIEIYKDNPRLPFDFSEHPIVLEAQVTQLKVSERFVQKAFEFSSYDEGGIAAFKLTYQRLMSKYHPDKGTDSDADKATLINEVREATRTLARLVRRQGAVQDTQPVGDFPFQPEEE